ATVYRMRRVLPEGLIGYNRPEETYVVEWTADTWYDVSAFDDLVNRAHKQEPRRAELLEEAISIYQGPYLSDVYSDWAAARREQLHQAYVEGLLMLARMRIASGDPGVGIELYRKALAEEPYREDLHCELMKALAGAGRLAEVVQQYNALVDLLRRELHSGPTDETERLFRSIHPRPQASS
ncbi:MAG: bacterial transcriptional activator domain-containing protein, partial [Chloroflexi bacterium]|nr:bacterial transcriptional activator domain-containing protein [Chloroflexota bacterium]